MCKKTKQLTGISKHCAATHEGEMKFTQKKITVSDGFLSAQKHHIHTRMEKYKKKWRSILGTINAIKILRIVLHRIVLRCVVLYTLLAFSYRLSR